MENQLQLVWNHEYKIDGIQYEESLTEIKDIRNMSNNDYWRFHTRAIGDSHYSILQLVNKENGEVKDEHIRTNVNDSQLDEFKENWNDFVIAVLKSVQFQPFSFVPILI